jgi:hypothetical protein
MKRANTWLEQRPEPHKWQGSPRKFRNLRLTTAIQSKRTFEPHVVSLSLNSSPLSQFVQRRPKNEFEAVDYKHSQVKHYLSLIEDPLWKKVCCYVENMMGPLSVIKIWECKLGSFSPKENNIEINCKTEEEDQFLKKYAFVILGGLKPYFPTIKELKVNQF